MDETNQMEPFLPQFTMWYNYLSIAQKGGNIMLGCGCYVQSPYDPGTELGLRNMCAGHHVYIQYVYIYPYISICTTNSAQEGWWTILVSTSPWGTGVLYSSLIRYYNMLDIFSSLKIIVNCVSHDILNDKSSAGRGYSNLDRSSGLGLIQPRLPGLFIFIHKMMLDVHIIALNYMK